MFYSRGTFKLFLAYHDVHSCPMPCIIRSTSLGCSLNNIANRMMNINISYTVDLKYVSTTTRACSLESGLCALFKGNSIQRGFALIDLKIFRRPSYTADIALLPIFETLKQLTGCRTLTLNLAVVERSDLEAQSQQLGADSLLIRTISAFEPTLGAGKLGPGRYPSMALPPSRQVVFHPRGRLVEMPRQKVSCEAGYS